MSSDDVSGDLDSRIGRLRDAHGAAAARVQATAAAVQHATEAQRAALLAGDVDAADRHGEVLTSARAEAATAATAQGTLRDAVAELERELQREERSSRRNQIAASIAATEEELRQMAAQADDAVTEVADLLRRGAALEDWLAATRGELQQLRVELGEVPAGTRGPTGARPVTDAIAGSPLLVAIANHSG